MVYIGLLFSKTTVVIEVCSPDRNIDTQSSRTMGVGHLILRYPGRLCRYCTPVPLPHHLACQMMHPAFCTSLK